MEKIGIMGGSFNPVHTGHLLLAQSAWYTFGLDRVIFMPVKENPFKAVTNMACDEDRFEMLKLATAQDPVFEVSDMELKRKGVTYTIDTLREMQCIYPDAAFYFITGGDIVFELPRWKEVDTLLKEAVFITACRPGYSGRGVKRCITALRKDYEARILELVTPEMEISSTNIRARVKRGEPVRYLVPPVVADYIQKKGLYLEENHSC